MNYGTLRYKIGQKVCFNDEIDVGPNTTQLYFKVSNANTFNSINPLYKKISNIRLGLTPVTTLEGPLYNNTCKIQTFPYYIVLQFNKYNITYAHCMCFRQVVCIFNKAYRNLQTSDYVQVI